MAIFILMFVFMFAENRGKTIDQSLFFFDGVHYLHVKMFAENRGKIIDQSLFFFDSVHYLHVKKKIRTTT